MMYYILMFMLMVSSMIFMTMSHPLAMGLMLLIQTVLICMTSGLMTSTFWFSYILFLIFLGGMLVLFIYVTSLASNEMFSFSMKMMTFIIISMALTMLTTLILDKSLMSMFMENNEMKMMNINICSMKENTLNLNKLYNFPTNMLTILIINYLLITLIAIVKLTNIFYGPLRHLN